MARSMASLTFSIFHGLTRNADASARLQPVNSLRMMAPGSSLRQQMYSKGFCTHTQREREGNRRNDVCGGGGGGGGAVG